MNFTWLIMARPSQFGYDLEAYYQWLMEINKAQSKVTDTSGEQKQHSNANRKEQKRLEAEFRRQFSH